MEVKNWNIDPTHSHIGFKVKHMMFSKVAGNFTDFTASIDMSDGDFENASLKFEADAASISTNNKERDEHLKTADFFNSEENAKVSFASTKVKKKDEHNYTIEGDLTMSGVTQPVKLEAEYSGIMKDPWGNDRIALVLGGKLNRTDWGINYNSVLESGGVLVGEKINFDIDTQFV